MTPAPTPAPAPAPQPVPQTAKPQTINERYGAQQQTVAQPAQQVEPKDDTTTIVDESKENDDNGKPTKRGSGLFEGIKRFGRKATEFLEKMDSNNNDDDIL